MAKKELEARLRAWLKPKGAKEGKGQGDAEHDGGGRVDQNESKELDDQVALAVAAAVGGTGDEDQGSPGKVFMRATAEHRGYSAEGNKGSKGSKDDKGKSRNGRTPVLVSRSVRDVQCDGAGLSWGPIRRAKTGSENRQRDTNSKASKGGKVTKGGKGKAGK